jgi:tocopherol O-methyltransferase
LFTKVDISRYYDLSEVHYNLMWNLRKSKSLHYGYWDDSVNSFHESLLNLNKVLAKSAGIKPSDHVLDAGCGIGGSSVWLAKNIGCKVAGISLNIEQVRKANLLAVDQNLADRVNFMVNDYTSTGFPDQSFDIVWGIESVCYADDKSDFLKEANRILKAGGKIIIADFFKRDNLKGKEAAIIQGMAHGWAINDFSIPHEFEHKLKENGFKILVNEDASQAIMPSAKRLYKAYLLGFIPAKLYGLLNRKATSLGKRNVDTAKYQYIGLKNKLWQYKIYCAEKIN